MKRINPFREDPFQGRRPMCIATVHEVARYHVLHLRDNLGMMVLTWFAVLAMWAMSDSGDVVFNAIFASIIVVAAAYAILSWKAIKVWKEWALQTTRQLVAETEEE